jgi:hypothetical protein
MEQILRTSMRMCGLDLSLSGWAPCSGFCRNSNERVGLIKTRKFLDLLNDCSLLV